MITVDYFSDVLCVWAYGGQIRVDTLERAFGTEVRLRHRFFQIFGDAHAGVRRNWHEKGGYEGFHDHLEGVCSQWDHTSLHPAVWRTCRPRSSANAHLYLKAVQLLFRRDESDPQGRRFEQVQARLRAAFFEEAQDIGSAAVLRGLLETADVPPAAVQALVDDGSAHAALFADDALKEEYGVKGSPTFVFNEGRQMLYGNVGYRIIEANIRELMRSGRIDGEPSWC